MTKRRNKTFLSLCFAAFVAVLTSAFAVAFTPKSQTVAAQTETVSYTADFSNGLPSDWSLYGQSNKSTMVATQKSASGLTIGNTAATNHFGTGINNYFGTTYRVAKTLGNVSDFTMEMTYTVSSIANTTNSSVSVIYRSATDWMGTITGYGMAYGANGNVVDFASAFSGVLNAGTASPSGKAQTVGQERTIKITLANNVAT
ncbi:MAG: hypothetical protein IJV80_01470, partial [Clostridia bacterium]|nr:hypothetical protein [Clostridia bacterium]